MQLWITPYFDFSDVFHTDQGPQFFSELQMYLFLDTEIRRIEYVTYSHNSLGGINVPFTPSSSVP